MQPYLEMDDLAIDINWIQYTNRYGKIGMKGIFTSFVS